MVSPEDRAWLRDRLLDRAGADPRLVAAAVTGSRAEGREDRWSDIGFTPTERFGPTGDGAFDVVFGTTGPRQPRPPDVDFLVGMGWHHVLHVRSAIERGRPWRAEYWLSSLRDVVLSLASIRHGLPHSYARSADDLPEEITTPMQHTLVPDLEPATLTAALAAGTAALLAELPHLDGGLAERLAPVLAAAAGR